MDQVKKLYVDCPEQQPAVMPDDFIVAVGKTKSNSVCHVAEVKRKLWKNNIRYHVKVFKSDLITALKRDIDQQLIPMQWYNRDKKPKPRD